MGRVYSNGTVFMETKERAIKNFWNKVNKTDSCWLWTGAKTTDGYGCFGNGRLGSKRAHRFSWEIDRETIPPNMELCHTCDNPSCVNPEHLFIGTHTDNMRDAARKKKFPLRYGTDHPRGKWSDEQVKSMVQLYNSGTPIKEICSLFGICRSSLGNILYRSAREHALDGIRVSKKKRTPYRKGEHNSRSRFKTDQILKIRNLYESGSSPKEIKSIFNLPEGTFWSIVCRSTWKHI